jgi:hypothetical protein
MSGRPKDPVWEHGDGDGDGDRLTVVVVMMVMVMMVVVVVEFVSQVYTSTFTHTYDVSNYMC